MTYANNCLTETPVSGELATYILRGDEWPAISRTRHLRWNTIGVRPDSMVHLRSVAVGTLVSIDSPLQYAAAPSLIERQLQLGKRSIGSELQRFGLWAGLRIAV